VTYFFKEVSTPVGELKLVVSDSGLVAILWENDNPKRIRFSSSLEKKAHPILEEAETQLHAYFAKQIDAFSVSP
jgi:methylated-DNA-[protein]-cysteine S-methyltransferase